MAFLAHVTVLKTWASFSTSLKRVDQPSWFLELILTVFGGTGRGSTWSAYVHKTQYPMYVYRVATSIMDVVNPVWWVRIRVTTYWIHWPQYNLALSDPQYKAHPPNPGFSLVKNDLLLFYISFLYLYFYPHSQHWVEMSINNKNLYLLTLKNNILIYFLNCLLHVKLQIGVVQEPIYFTSRTLSL